MDPITFGLATLFLGYQLGNKKKKEPIYQGRCRAPIWALFKNLETAINVPKPSAVYPLSRYWLHLDSVDRVNGGISAYLEFVERVDRKKFFLQNKAKAVIKKFGFIWVIQEILTPSQVELSVTLFWTDISPGKASQYEEVILQTIISLTRDLVSSLNQSSKTASANPISGPPPVQSQVQQGKWVGPPPSSMSQAPPSSQVPAKTNLRGSVNPGRRSNNKITFRDMSRSKPVDQEEQSRRLIEWPTPQDYHETIQNPSTCFVLKQLRNGMPVTDALGMPRVASGAFASVYRMQCLDRDRAVRCFLHPLKNRQYRYEILSTSMRDLELPWTVGFEYLSQGICINNNWYPILMMDWVEGSPLNSYVSELCRTNNTKELESLRRRFQEMTIGLKDSGIAHGDLQHGNILVNENKLVLVDYDGMYVPELAEEKSNELGHPNYQHPGRNEHHFDENTDNFSQWVIDTALLCLQEDPSLWELNYGGEETLLFHRQDFLYPEESAVLLHLCRHSSAKIRKRIDLFKGMMYLRPEEVPALDCQKGEKSVSTEKTNDSAQNNSNSTGLPDWLDEISSD